MGNITLVDDYNVSSLLYNSTLRKDSGSMSSLLYQGALCALLSLIILVALLGNGFVIFAFCVRPKLHKATNFFILNLAIADLALAALVLPLSASYDILGRWIFGKTICLIWTVFDILVSTASILTLVAISADRYMAISSPLKYPKRVTSKKVVIVIVTIWFVAFTISIPPALGWRLEYFTNGTCYIPNSVGYVVYSAIGSFYIPFIVISVLYYKIYKIKKRSMVGSLLDMSQLERADSCSSFFTNEKSGRRQTSSSSGYSSSKYGNCPRYSQVSRSTMDSVIGPASVQPAGSRSSLSKQDSNDTLMVPGQLGPGQLVPGQRYQRNYMLFSPLSSRSSRSSGSISDLDGASLIVPRDVMKSSRSSSSSYGADMESDLIKDYFKLNLATPRASYISHGSSVTSRSKRPPISRRIRRFLSERKAAKTVSIIVGAFIICWTPFSIVYLLNGVCKDKCNISHIAFKVCFWLGYINSVLNPIIYSVYNQDMKAAVINLLSPICCLCCHKRKPNLQRGHHFNSSFGSRLSVNESNLQFSDSMSVNEPHNLKHDKYLNREIRQSMPTESCPVQVFINEPRKSRENSIVSWSMAALREAEAIRMSSDDIRSLQSDKSVILPAVNYNPDAVDGNSSSRDDNTVNVSPSRGRTRSLRRVTSSAEMVDEDSSPDVSPKTQRRRSTTAFLNPLTESSWTPKIPLMDREILVRRSSKVPSLEDIQETLSQDTRRSSDETASNATHNNSFEQIRNTSLEGTSSTSSSLQDSRKSSLLVANHTMQSSDNIHIGSAVAFVSGDGILPGNQRVLKARNTFPDLSVGMLKPCYIRNQHLPISVNEKYFPQRSRGNSLPLYDQHKAPAEGIHVSLVETKGKLSTKTLRVNIKSLAIQKLHNIEIVFDDECNMECQSDGSRLSPKISETASLSPESLYDSNFHRSLSDSSLLPPPYRSNITAKTCTSAPTRRRRASKLMGSIEQLQDQEKTAAVNVLNDSDSNIHGTIDDSSNSLDGRYSSSSTLSSLMLGALFDVHEQHSGDGCQTVSHSTIPSETEMKIRRSKSEPSLGDCKSREPMALNAFTPKYSLHIQELVSSIKRDSVASSVNTEYTYEEVPTPVAGTEYDGNSQRSSLTSNADSSNCNAASPDIPGAIGDLSIHPSPPWQISLKPMNIESDSDDIKLPAIHITEADENITVFQVSTTVPYQKQEIEIKELEPAEEHGKQGEKPSDKIIARRRMSLTQLDLSSQATGSRLSFETDFLSLATAGSKPSHPEVSRWLESNMNRIQAVFNRCILKTLNDIIQKPLILRNKTNDGEPSTPDTEGDSGRHPAELTWI